MPTINGRAQRGQGAMWLLPLLVLVAAGVWFMFTTSQENARLRAELDGAKPGGTPPPAAARPATPPAGTSPAATTSGARVLDADHQTAMRQVLAGGSGGTKNAWIQVQAGDREAGAYAESLAATFKQAGWNATTMVVNGMNLKAGIFFFEAEEESPEYVGVVRDALKAAGVEPMMAAGYRAYYEEKKKENPRWVGVEIAPGQDFAIVIGPKPAG
jgi:hypothetical protein